MTDDLHANQRYWLLDARAHVRAWNQHHAWMRSWNRPLSAEETAARDKAERERAAKRAASEAKQAAIREEREAAQQRKRDQLRRGWVDHRWNRRDDIRDHPVLLAWPRRPS